MQKYIILRLCNLLRNDSDKIRSLIGVCEDYYQFKQHPFFISCRPHAVPISFQENPHGLCKNVGNQWLFTGGEYIARTIFLGFPIKEGIFQWSIRYKYSKKYASKFCFGISPPAFLVECRTKTFDNVSEYTGTPAFWCYRKPDGMLTSGFCGIHGVDYRENAAIIDEDSLLSAEIDMNVHTLSFFVDQKKVPHSVDISRFPTPLYFGVGAYGNQSFTTVSLLRMPSPTLSSVLCKMYQPSLLGREKEKKEK